MCDWLNHWITHHLERESDWIKTSAQECYSPTSHSHLLPKLIIRLIDSFSISHPVLPGNISEREPPDPISNSEVKTFSADDSVGFPHVKVGHCQALILKKAHPLGWAFFFGSGKIKITHMRLIYGTCSFATRWRWKDGTRNVVWKL